MVWPRRRPRPRTGEARAAPRSHAREKAVKPQSSAHEAAFRIDAPAKINLYLHILGRRSDGYHQLDSLIGFTEAHDLLEVRAAPGLSLVVEGPFAGALSDVDDNLVMRAARNLRSWADIDAGAALLLDKKLPVAAGLGGGSSDAAAALRALTRLWNLDIGADELARLGAMLGADVPACLAGTPLYAGGIGEIIEQAPPLPPIGVVLVNPGVALSTAAVYGARGGPFSQPAPRFGAAGDAGFARARPSPTPQ